MRLLDGDLCNEEPRREELSPDKATIASQISIRGRVSLKMLLDAMMFARDVNRPAWDFAVEIALLNEHGLSHTDLRWLICSSYIESAVEMRCSENGRSFQHGSELRLSRNSCFVLTDSGVAFVRELLGSTAAQSSPTPAANPSASPSLAQHSIIKPVWDRDRQELRVGEQVIKQFKVPAPNQEMVLAAFQEEDWPVRIDDPLPPQPDLEPKRRLHDTIVSLNRNHKANLIRFLGDGSGQGVRWELRM